MTNETKSFPVKYMVLREPNGYWIADTSQLLGTSTVCRGMDDLDVAHHICKLLNEAEGYRYEY